MPTPSYPQDHPFSRFKPTDAAENIYYADLFRINNRNWMILGSGKSKAAMIASNDEKEAMYGTDSIAILREGDRLWARYDLGVLPTVTHENPELWTKHRLDAIAYCLDEEQTQFLAEASGTTHSIVSTGFRTLSSLCATYPYPAAMALHFFSTAEFERLSDPDRMMQRFAELTSGTKGTSFLLVPHMARVEEKADLYRTYQFD